MPQPVTVVQSSSWARRATGTLLAMPEANKPVLKLLRSVPSQSG